MTISINIDDNLNSNDDDSDTNENNENNENDENNVKNKKKNKLKTSIWGKQHEKILIEWGDKAICYSWLHTKEHHCYNFKNRWYTIPVIIMSTLTGTANFAQERIPLEYVPYYTICVGAINILAGIITTIQQFLKITELNEAHRVSAISWDKFYRNIKLELSKAPCERMQANQMLKISKEEYNRLIEISPSISNKSIKAFKAKFQGKPIKNKIVLIEKQEKFKDLIKPEICDIIETTKNSVYIEHPEDKAKRNTQSVVEYVNNNNEFKRKTIMVEEFIKSFNERYKRQPNIEEIHDNLNNNIETNELNNIIKSQSQSQCQNK